MNNALPATTGTVTMKGRNTVLLDGRQIGSIQTSKGVHYAYAFGGKTVGQFDTREDAQRALVAHDQQ